MKNWNAPILYALIYQLLLAGCASHSRIWVLSLDECVEQLEKQIESRPAQTHLETLDGQKVNMDEFFQLCLMNSPPCALPDKFYYWENEVKLIVSETTHGYVSHKIRSYHNYMTICRPGQIDPQKTHGDITEFYSENGEFMGLAVYLGNGLYYPLPYSKYSGAKEKLPYWMKKIHMPPQSSRLTGTSSLKRTESL
jgi:hypothetical protein